MASIDSLRQLFREGHALTLQEASDQTGVSRRQVRRNINQLREEGLPIRERRDREGHKCFAIAPSHWDVETTVRLKEIEWHSLMVASLAAQSPLSETPFRDGLQSALQQLLSEGGAQFLSFDKETYTSKWHFDEGHVSNIAPTTFLTVVDATVKSLTLQVEYTTAYSGERSEGRRIDPLALAHVADSWLVAAYCHQNHDVRDFAIAGISHASETGEVFFPEEYDFDADAHFGNRFGALKGEQRRAVRIAVPADKAVYFKRKQYHSSQSIDTVHDDGRIEVTFEVSSLESITSFLRSWGPLIRVLHPPELAKRIAEEAKKTAALYQDHSRISCSTQP